METKWIEYQVGIEVQYPVPCVNCFMISDLMGIARSYELYEHLDLDIIHTDEETKFKFKFKLRHIKFTFQHPIVAEMYFKASSEVTQGCHCINCCLQFFILTNNYATFIHMKPQNPNYKFYLALMAMHGPHYHQLLLRKCVNNEFLFVSLFEYYSAQLMYMRSLIASEIDHDPLKNTDYILLSFISLLECSKWFTFKHVEWLLSSNKSVEYLCYFILNREKYEELDGLAITIMTRIYKYSVIFPVKYNKLIKNVHKYMDLITMGYGRCFKQGLLEKNSLDLSKTDTYMYYKKNVRNQSGECGNNKCKVSSTKLYICSGCQLMYYCSRKCQKYAWSRLNHKYHCLKLRTLSY
eukprot:33898_1